MIERLLVGWGVVKCIRTNQEGWNAIHAMAVALVTTTASRERHSQRGVPLSLAARLDRALPQPARRRLEVWFWASNFQLARPTVDELETWLQDGHRIPTIVDSALRHLNSEAFGEQLIATRLGRAGTRIGWHYRMLEARLSTHGARDLYTGESIITRRMFSRDEDDEQGVGVQVHHLVPLDWAKRMKLHADVQLRCGGLANLTPLAPFTNTVLIRDEAPADYLRALEVAGAANIDTLLEGHFVNPELLRALRSDCPDLDTRVERFLADRQRRIVRAFGAALSVDSLETPASAG